MALVEINEGERPLGLYVFSKDPETAERVLRQTTSGGACVNVCAVQGALPTLGFGGVGTVCNELAQACGLGVLLDEERLPVRPMVNGACELLGIDPLYVANEGKFVAVVAPDETDAGLAALRSHPLGVDAAEVGEIVTEPAESVVLRTGFGGTRIVDMLVGDPLPRIC